MSSCGFFISKIVSFDNLPKPSGPYDVGTQIFTWEDTTRFEWFTTYSKDYRKIVVQIWYPADYISGAPIPYLDQWQERIGSAMRNRAAPGARHQDGTVAVSSCIGGCPHGPPP